MAAPEYEVIEVNIPPEFEGTLPSTIEIDLMESDRGEILIPGYKDFNGDNVTLHVSELPFSKFEDSKLSFENLTEADVGEY